MSFRLVPKSVTSNDLEWRNGRYIALFHWIGFQHITASARIELIDNVVRVRCRRKESSRSLSHLLMSFLLSSDTRHAFSRAFICLTVLCLLSC